MKRVSSSPLARLLVTLLAVVFITSQSTALAHEVEHVLHQHQTPCALHDAAEHLTFATPPIPPLVAVPTPVGIMPVAKTSRVRALAICSADARAPPVCA